MMGGMGVRRIMHRCIMLTPFLSSDHGIGKEPSHDARDDA
jgi:hypothetical protein